MITASAGNHGAGVAYACSLFGLRATVFVPENAPQAKLDNIQRWLGEGDLGGEIVKIGESFDLANEQAQKKCAETKVPFIPPYTHPDVWAGQAFNIISALPDLIAQGVRVDKPLKVLVPVGGGGLAIGMSSFLKSIFPTCEIIGVEPENFAKYSGGWRPQDDQERIQPKAATTIADGTRTLTYGTNREPLWKAVDKFISVTEKMIEAALAELMRISAIASIEGAGALALAAFNLPTFRAQKEGVKEAKENPPLIVISGGNIDSQKLQQIILAESGAAASSKPFTFQAK